MDDLAGKLGMTWEACASGILEISAWNQANALRQVTVKRGLDVRDFHLVTFGGSGSLLACRLVDVLDLAGVLVPLDPGNLSAYGLLTVDVRNDYVQTAVARQSRLSVTAVQSVFDDLRSQADAALDREGFAADSRRFVRTADLRYYGQAFEVRVEVPDEAVTPRLFAVVAERFHEEHKVLYGYDFRSDGRQEVEWVNLRVTGVGPIRKPGPRTVAAGAGAQTARSGTRRGVLRRLDRDRDLRPGPPRRGRRRRRPGGAGGVQLHRPAASGFPGHRRRRRQPADHALTDGGQRVSGYRLTTAAQADPVLVEIVEGYLAAVEQEVETAIGRTSRSPMIRDAHDYRAGIHDRHLRKLTGRSYSALVQPVARDYPLDTMRPGDVFFHNDVYLSEGGIGHLPDLCVTAPVFHDSGAGSEVVGFVQAFGHHDDIGGAVPGSMPSHATSVFEEGLMVPPIKLWDAGVPCEQALKIMTRNSRMPESLAADLDAECSACLLGARRLAALFGRYGKATVEACFDAYWTRPPRRSAGRCWRGSPAGTYTWEDYAEHDGVDEPRLHTQRITLTKIDDNGGDSFSTSTGRAHRPGARSTTAVTTPTATS